MKKSFNKTNNMAHLFMTPQELNKLIIGAVSYGKTKAAVDAAMITPYINQKQAWRLYGESRVKTWVNDGIIKPSRKPGTRFLLYSREELELAALSYLNIVCE